MQFQQQQQQQQGGGGVGPGPNAPVPFPEDDYGRPRIGLRGGWGRFIGLKGGAPPVTTIPTGTPGGTGKFFSKVKLSLVIWTTFEFSRQKLQLWTKVF